MKIDLSDNIVFEKLSKVADKLGYPCYVVGGYVRDKLLGLPNDDIDVVVVGSGPRMAEEFAKSCGGSLQIFKSYGTAKVDEVELTVE